MRKTKEEAEQTRQALLESALKIFDEKGYENTTLSNIAEKANVTRGALYHHFKNKDDLLKQLAESCYTAHIARTEAILNQENSWREYASQLSESLAELTTNQALVSFIRIIETQRAFNDKQSVIVEQLNHYDELLDEQLKRVIDIALTEGDIPAETNQHLAFLHVNCMIHGIIRTLIYSPKQDVNHAHIEWLIYQSFDAVQSGAFCN